MKMCKTVFVSKTYDYLVYIRTTVFILITLGLVITAQAGGLSCSVGEVVIENLKIGNTYSLITLANLPLLVTNTGPRAVTVLVEPLVPATTETSQGAEPIPALSWAKAVPDSFELAPRETRAVEMIISIPEQEAYFGKKLQVNFWSHTLAKDGEFLAYGISSRVVFSVDLVREESKTMPKGDLSFSILPAEMSLKNLSAGVVYNLKDLLKKPLKVHNTSSKKLVIEIKALKLEESAASAPEGYADLWGSANLSLSPSILYLEPGEEKSVSGTIRFDKKGKFSSKNFIGIICAAVTDQDIKTQIYSRIYAHFK